MTNLVLRATDGSLSVTDDGLVVRSAGSCFALLIHQSLWRGTESVIVAIDNSGAQYEIRQTVGKSPLKRLASNSTKLLIMSLDHLEKEDVHRRALFAVKKVDSQLMEVTFERIFTWRYRAKILNIILIQCELLQQFHDISFKVLIIEGKWKIALVSIYQIALTDSV